ncbi:hypothetical protein [Dehalobacter restrictus]|uniref:hypothetical protein n=1 Tax=Dehalobacter restrictus TaxID=55583 RepID=UPI00338D5811
MKIPEKIKIGGRIYKVTVTENIGLGSNYTAEINYCKLEINVRPMAQGKMEQDFLHELMHAIFDFNGCKDHDEEMIDRLASALHMILQDNPGVFGDCDA